MATFERNGTESAATGQAADRFECGICWHVYDPVAGDEQAQIPPGTSFDALPAQWTCPVCDAPKHKFLRNDET